MSGPGGARRRILLLTPRWPYPVIGGDVLRIWRLAQAMARHHDVTLLSLCANRQELQSPVPDDGVFTAVHRVYHPRWRALSSVLRALPGTLPLQVAYYRNPEFRRRVLALAPAHDLVCAHLVRMAPYALLCPRPRWLEMTDAISLGMGRVAASGLPWWSPRRWLYAEEARRLAPWERSMPAHFDRLSLIAQPDAVHLWGPDPAHWPPGLRIAPNGVEGPTECAPPAGQRPPCLVFVGQLRSLPNQDALAFVLDEVLPRVRERHPEVTLEVVGPCPPALRQRWGDREAVRFHGPVPRLADVLGRARIGLCPVRMGAGMQNKLLDYLAHGMAAITSPVGLEGLDARPGEDLLLADHADDWVAQIERLLRDDDLASRLGESGRQRVTSRHGWVQALEPLAAEWP